MAMAFLSWVVAIPLLGFLTGARSMTPIAVLCWFSYFGHMEVHRAWPFWTTKLITAIIFSVLALGEFIGDKLPKVPDRTSAFPLIVRIGFAGLVGAICAQSLHGSELEGILLAVIAAAVGTFVTYHLRQYLVRTQGCPDLSIALSEDILAVGLSVIALGIITG